MPIIKKYFSTILESLTKDTSNAANSDEANYFHNYTNKNNIHGEFRHCRVSQPYTRENNINYSNEAYYYRKELMDYFFNSLKQTLNELDSDILYLQDYNDDHYSFLILDIPIQVFIPVSYNLPNNAVTTDNYYKSIFRPVALPCLPCTDSTSNYLPIINLTSFTQVNLSSYKYNNNYGNNVYADGTIDDYIYLSHGINNFQDNLLELSYGFEVTYNSNYIHIMLISYDNKRVPFLFIIKGKSFDEKDCWYLSGEPNTYCYPHLHVVPTVNNRLYSSYQYYINYVYTNRKGFNGNCALNRHMILFEDNFVYNTGENVYSDGNKILPLNFTSNFPSKLTANYNSSYYYEYPNIESTINLDVNDSSYTKGRFLCPMKIYRSPIAPIPTVKGTNTSNTYQILNTAPSFYDSEYYSSENSDISMPLGGSGNKYSGIFTKLDLYFSQTQKDILGLNDKLIMVPPLCYYGLITFENMFVVPDDTVMNRIYKTDNGDYATPKSDFSLDHHPAMQKLCFKI